MKPQHEPLDHFYHSTADRLRSIGGSIVLSVREHLANGDVDPLEHDKGPLEVVTLLGAFAAVTAYNVALSAAVKIKEIAGR